MFLTNVFNCRLFFKTLKRDKFENFVQNIFYKSLKFGGHLEETQMEEKRVIRFCKSKKLFRLFEKILVKNY